ncbi:DUF4190 domain-containing protein [Leucobacter komagatae]|uniref:DUF4190 domain-containing protein n=1 Tax=Leucobacter komagatae TaxID=55969 RepID=UPI000696DB02|nr:DUF4190 domain-containing protein [Leucobacter komagatae]
MSTINPQEPSQYGQNDTAAQPTVPFPADQSPSAPQFGTAAYAAPYAPHQNAAQQYEYPGKAPAATTLKDTNTYAVIAIILAFIAPIAGIIFGHLGLNQVKRNGDAGRGLALTALIYGYCVTALGILFIGLYISAFALMIGAATSAGFSSY